MSKNNIIQDIAEAPAKVLEQAIAQSHKATRAILSKRPVKEAEAYWHTLGPGLTTGASDDDPSGIATYSQAGAKYGFGLLWLAAFTFPLMAVVQEMCARIGLATGRGLAANIREHYKPWVVYLSAALLFIANTFNLGADFGAMAQGVQLFWPAANFMVVVLVLAGFILLLQIFTSYDRYARYLKYLALILLLYILVPFTIGGINWREIFHAATVPHITWSKDFWFLLAAVLGTTISPYLFFWQTSQEVEERHLAGKLTVLPQHVVLPKKVVRKMRVDVWSGMFLSNVVMFFIIVATGVTLFPKGILVMTAADAARALEPLAGRAAFALFGVGIIGTGLLAIPVLSGSAAYALADVFHWKAGLYRKLKSAYAFYGVIIIATILGVLMNVIGIDPIKALLYSAVLNAIVSPVALICIVQLSSKESVMGRWKNHPVVTMVGWFIVVLMIVAGLGAVVALW